jgi:dTDP-4-amino-4,6-dideoxygalactose transaminase
MQVLKWRDQEIAIPAYTCAVVPHAIELSGNRVCFADCESDHINVSAQGWSRALTSRTKMVIFTPLFGYPLDLPGCNAIVARKASGAFILFDAAQ